MRKAIPRFTDRLLHLLLRACGRHRTTQPEPPTAHPAYDGYGTRVLAVHGIQFSPSRSHATKAAAR